jgi:hypothetical protein
MKRLFVILLLACPNLLCAQSLFMADSSILASTSQTPAPAAWAYATNLTVLYRFASGALLADSSGNGRDAVCSNGTLVADANGASFTNKPYLTVPNSAIVSNNGTIAMRMYPRFTGTPGQAAQTDVYYSLSAGGTDKFFGQFTLNRWDARGPGWTIQAATNTCPSNIWYDVVMTWSTNAGVGATVYLSSNNLAEITVVGTDTTISDAAGLNRFRVGDYTSLGYPVDGVIRDFRVYDRRMTGTETTNIVTDMRR